MAHGLKCYCCGENNTSDEFYYCLQCLKKLQIMFNSNKNLINDPQHYNHCISCGEFKNRKILYTGGSCSFPDHGDDGIPICNRCVEDELKRY